MSLPGSFEDWLSYIDSVARAMPMRAPARVVEDFLATLTPEEGRRMTETVKRYDTTYWSASKRAEVRIEDMPYPHLVNAINKVSVALDPELGGDPRNGDGVNDAHVLECLHAEKDLRDRQYAEQQAREAARDSRIDEEGL